MQKKLSIFFVFCVLASSLFAQLPKSNVYLFDMVQDTDTTFSFTNPQFLSHFNENGYNNQPVFIEDDLVYITIQRPYDIQADLYAFDLTKNTKTRITDTPESEFSAARTPSFYEFSAVRQEIQGQDTILRLWQFPLDRLTNGKPVFKYITNIGYYSWIDAFNVAVFLVDQPNTLAIANTRTDEIQPLASNAGRCFKKLNNGNLAYVQKGEFTDEWHLKEQNLYRSELPATTLVATPIGAEDFIVLEDGTFVMGQGSKLYKFNRYKDEDWVEIVNLSYYTITNISRLAYRNNKIIIVAD